VNLLIVVGARPNFMKVAPIMQAIKRYNDKNLAKSDGAFSSAEEVIRPTLVHTGQHYDDLMSGAFFRDLDLPKPDVYLGVGSGSHAVQTAEIMKKFEPVLLKAKPDVVAVVGDVNSTLACALVASKTSFDPDGRRPMIAHVEAGLRSLDRSMPEEINRVLTDHLSDLLFVTEESGLRNLCKEGISPDKMHFVGNTMIDALLTLKNQAEQSPILTELGLKTEARKNELHGSIVPYALLTLHRPGNVDDRDALLDILKGLDELTSRFPLIFPVHPRTRQRIKEFGVDAQLAMSATHARSDVDCSTNGRHGIELINPLGYLDFLCLMNHATIVVTDSGGIQEETTVLGIPCVTVRENTERPVTVQCGTNVIAGTKADTIRAAIRSQLRRKAEGKAPKGWDGHAASRIIDILVRQHSEKLAVQPNLLPGSAHRWDGSFHAEPGL
jgi:UDP-N-acetylglucosamine 2-epimerase (non-hydrolysing)